MREPLWQSILAGVLTLAIGVVAVLLLVMVAATAGLALR